MQYSTFTAFFKYQERDRPI